MFLEVDMLNSFVGFTRKQRHDKRTTSVITQLIFGQHLIQHPSFPSAVSSAILIFARLARFWCGGSRRRRHQWNSEPRGNFDVRLFLETYHAATLGPGSATNCGGSNPTPEGTSGLLFSFEKQMGPCSHAIWCMCQWTWRQWGASFYLWGWPRSRGVAFLSSQKQHFLIRCDFN